MIEGEADLALTFDYAVAESKDSHPDLHSELLMDDVVFVVLPFGHRLATMSNSSNYIAFKELSHERWVAGCARCRNHLLSLALSSGFDADVRHVTDDYVVAQQLVGANRAVALLPGLALAAAPNDRVIVKRIVGDPVRRIRIILRRESSFVPAVKAALDAFHTFTDREEFAQLKVN